MCVIVDTNCFACVFNSSDSSHAQFKPIFDHIDNGKSKLTIGGTGYMRELQKLGRYSKLIAEMTRSRRAVTADSAKVDALEASIAGAFKDPSFNDKHIVALTYASNAKLVCTKDKTLEKYTKAREFYNRGKSIPKIYNERSRASVLPEQHFRPLCKLC